MDIVPVLGASTLVIYASCSVVVFTIILPIGGVVFEFGMFVHTAALEKSVTVLPAAVPVIPPVNKGVE